MIRRADSTAVIFATSAAFVGPFWSKAPKQRSASWPVSYTHLRAHETSLHLVCRLLLDALKHDQAEAAILVPNCPVCHQSATLAARHLEEADIPTVVMGCAKDIVESAGAPRFIFSDFPLGNGAGKPHDKASQRETLALAFNLLENAKSPETIINPQVWSRDHSWKDDYSNPEKLSSEELAQKRAAFDAGKQAAKSVR